jgi:hypothetical protein
MPTYPSPFTYDRDSDGKWMIYDERKPETAPCVARQIPTEEQAQHLCELLNNDLKKGTK